MSIREKEFGEKSLDYALSFKYKTGLRFGLSEGSLTLKMFVSAYKKIEKILKYAFQGSNKTTVCLVYYGEDTILSNLSSLKLSYGWGTVISKYKDYLIWV